MWTAALRSWQSFPGGSPCLPPPSPPHLISPLALPQPPQPPLQLALPLPPALVNLLLSLSLIITQSILLLSTVEDVSKEVSDSLEKCHQLISSWRPNLLIDFLLSVLAPPVPPLGTSWPLSSPTLPVSARSFTGVLPDASSSKTLITTLSRKASTTSIPPAH